MYKSSKIPAATCNVVKKERVEREEERGQRERGTENEREREMRKGERVNLWLPVSATVSFFKAK